MQISVTTPVEQALNHTKAILFDDFRFRMWLGLGFCSFLAHLGTGAQFNGNFRQPFPGGSGGASSNAPDQIREFVTTWGLLVVLAAVLLFVVYMVVLWLQSRGRFMFLDGVLNNSGAVSEPWRRFRYLGDSVFRLQAGLALIGAVIVVPFSIGLLLQFVYADRLGPAGGILPLLLVLWGLLVVLYALVNLAVALVLGDFLVPLMYRRNLLVSDAWSAFRNELLPGHFGAMLRFYGMKFILGIAIGLLTAIGACVTCCVLALPYVSSVAFLPFTVFGRLFSIYFLEQFGPDWWFFAREEAAPPPPAADPLRDISPAPEPPVA